MSDSASPKVEYYWRPGCPFCARLEHDLKKAGIKVEAHNIWDDPSAAATVRSLANGNETVPTIRIGKESLVNPPIAEVLALLST